MLELLQLIDKLIEFILNYLKERWQLILAIIVIAFIINIIASIIQGKKTKNFSKKAETNIEEILKQEKIFPNKKIIFLQPAKDILDSEKYSKFIVEERNKKFGIVTYSEQNQGEIELLTFDYNDLLGFKIHEALSNHKEEKKTSSLSVEILVKDLDTPNISLLLCKNVDKGNDEFLNFEYLEAKKNANEIVGTLTYIESQKSIKKTKVKSKKKS